eukprot:m.100249 g.100249  ORF g.100249 m.100249 type:complete len:678 (+) comp9042_c1_seq1:209-2242(+)
MDAWFDAVEVGMVANTISSVEEGNNAINDGNVEIVDGESSVHSSLDMDIIDENLTNNIDQFCEKSEKEPLSQAFHSVNKEPEIEVLVEHEDKGLIPPQLVEEIDEVDASLLDVTFTDMSATEGEEGDGDETMTEENQGGGHDRVSVKIMRDLSKIKEHMTDSAKKGHSLINQVGSWLSCIFNAKTEQATDEFEIKFDEIKELKFLGSGAQGCVFLGTYKHEEVAVKKLRDASTLDKEKGLLQKLDHQNIIKLKGVCMTDPVFGVVMEYCPNSLYEIIRGHQLPPEWIVEWGAQIADGMLYLHKMGIVHRDLKSANILVAQDQKTLRISDFGCCREYKQGKSSIMSFSGTAAWMAPEIIRSESCSERVDVWSFGVVLWELLTGEIPYKGVDATAIVWGVGNNNLRLPVPDTAPDGFKLLLKQCWNATPKHRPEFRQILLHLTILSRDDKFCETPHDEFYGKQQLWKAEIRNKFKTMKIHETIIKRRDEDLIAKREEELRHVQDIRETFERKLKETTDVLSRLHEMELRLKKKEKMIDSGRKKRRKSRNGSNRRNRKSSSSSSSTIPLSSSTATTTTATSMSMSMSTSTSTSSHKSNKNRHSLPAEDRKPAHEHDFDDVMLRLEEAIEDDGDVTNLALGTGNLIAVPSALYEISDDDALIGNNDDEEDDDEEDDDPLQV